MKPCIDLKARFGKTYRITRDEACEDRNDPWTLQLPCRGQGVAIYPHGGDLLAVEVNHRPSVARLLAAIPGVRIHQDGGWGGEMTFLFPVALFEQVAAVVKPRRKRKCHLTDEQKARLAERGRQALDRLRSRPIT